MIGVVGAAAVLVSLSATPARALPPVDGEPDVLAAVGSDTTSGVIAKIAKKYRTNATVNPDPDNTQSVPPVLAPGASFTIPAEDSPTDPCGAGFTYDNDAGTPAPLPPNGSSSGITALVNDTTGCVDWARSSRQRGGSDPASLSFWAFARDAMDWATFRGTDALCPGGDNFSTGGPRGCSPKNLTLTQIRDIYLCDAGETVPDITNWSQVGGDNEPIVVYNAQSGSGTQAFWQTGILGIPSPPNGGNPDANCATPSKRMQESAGTDVLAADRPMAIMPYSFANWTSQSNSAQTLEPDLRAGSKLGKIGGITPNATTILDGSYVGWRHVHNVTKSTSPQISQVIRLVGVAAAGGDGVAEGWVCSGAQAANVSLFGFIPLPEGPTGGGFVPSRCRLDTTQ